MAETEKEGTAGNLYLDTTKISNREHQQKESVTDRYGIDVFSDEFEKTVQNIEEEEILTVGELNEQIFVTNIAVERDSSITEKLFGETRESFGTAVVEKTGYNTSGYDILLIVTVCFMVIIIWQRAGKRKKNAGHNIKKREYDGDKY